MSTFKRLVNLGKGKIKTATSGSSTPAASTTEDWVSDARNKAADAAEALADALRPEEATPSEPAEEAAVRAETPEVELPDPPATKATGPVKKTL
ncbi:MAG: hypothetical protein KC912_16230 [Proteobacteria bacterium]|nr:hypothetical protein [Pseudomonadota bacterium]